MSDYRLIIPLGAYYSAWGPCVALLTSSYRLIMPLGPLLSFRLGKYSVSIGHQLLLILDLLCRLRTRITDYVLYQHVV